MSGRYFVGTFVLCLCVWAVVVDHVVLPSMDRLKQDVGVYSRYRVKEWNESKKFDLIKDELLVYAYVENREQLYYIEYTPYFEATLKSLSKGDPIQLGYAQRLPKVWKRGLYDLRQGGVTLMRFSPVQLKQKQEFVWKVTGIVGGIYLFMVIVGLIAKPKKR
jgi:hypothetical protein